MPEKSRQAQDHREAVRKVRAAHGFTLTLPMVGRVAVPRPEQLAFYGALGVLAAVEIIDWPVALLLGAGHLLLHNEHSRIAQEIGEALEEA
jgi:hypothetical protein